ncbi:ABC transporter permease subunit [uncultured Nitratireductor sp.]|uniref:ABC transporter permease subunit n=1 Tax=uncultured Nitratireductor sp. TaxID=520953 RepID=UPI0025D06038|nr:ABC transporter permease subunit [uncultured Nitratireductor sp.]
MIERTPLLNILTHVILVAGALLLIIPIWLAFVAATLTVAEVNSTNVHYLPGGELWNNLTAAWTRAEFGVKFMNSMIVAIAVVIGKVIISAISAFSIVFFNYRLRMVFFWVIFITLMLPLEVRIVPTYSVAANALYPFQTILDATGISWLIAQISGVELSLEWNMLNSYTGLILPLVATATGTFLYRQFFLTIPDELVEATKMDGSGPFRFFIEVLLPLSRTNIAALATIMFVYAWNQYLWPLLIITDRANYSTVVMELRRLIPGPDAIADWNVAMAGTLIVMLPPLLVVVLMQRWFVRGLISTEK